MKNKNINTIDAQVTAMVLENVKYSVLAVSVLINLTVFVTWLTIMVA